MFGTVEIEEFFAGEITRVVREYDGRMCNILSIGSGECSLELEIAKRLAQRNVEFSVTCNDLSEEMLIAGERQVAEAAMGKSFRFVPGDVNREFPDGTYDIVIANHCLHHFVQLEAIFDSVREALPDDGAFIVSDMIGRNGHMRWPEVRQFVEVFWRILDQGKKRDNYHGVEKEEFVDFDCSQDCFEGIRAQDILPIMLEKFYFERFLGYGGIPDVFVDRMYGPNFDAEDPRDRGFVDTLELTNDALTRGGIIKPTMMFATVRKCEAKCVFDPVHPSAAVRMPNFR